MRRRAEGHAANTAADRPDTLSPEEARSRAGTGTTTQTLHELRVHQIELEMQNEELRRAQADLDAARGRYFDLYDLAPVGYCTLSEKGLILEANLTAATLLGVARGALITQPFTRFILPEDQDFYYLHRRQLFGAGEPQAYELRMVKQDGTVFWAHLDAAMAPALSPPNGQDPSTLRPGSAQASSGQGAEGAPVCRAVVSDITERKRAEGVLQQVHDELEQRVAEQTEESRQANEALRANNELFSLFIRHSPIYTYIKEVTPTQSLVLQASDNYREMIGIPGCEMVGKTMAELFPPEFAAKITADDWAVVSRGDVLRLDEELNGRSYATIKFPIVWGDKTLLAGYTIDITERKEAEAEREKLEAELRQAQKMESVGRLAGGVAHDFNNMLSIILGHAQLALRSIDPSNPLHADLEEIQKAGQRSAELTRQLLAFARKQTVAPKVLDLNTTVERMLTMLRRLIGEDIDLAWRPGAGLWPVKVDPSQINQILANLCANARDAIADVGKLALETANIVCDEAYCAEHPGLTPGEYVMLAVSDNGCGMDRETLANVFEPFFTTKEMGKGTGLGLATVYGIVKQNHGFIAIDSAPGEGTTFKMYLPRYGGKTAQAAAEGPSEVIKSGSEMILLVEDEPTILKLGKTMLEQLGYTVLAASAPGEAIRLAREHTGKLHLLMTDVVMPGMNGRDLAKHLLSLYPRLKRLFMSGYTADVIAQHGVLDEGVSFIQKPFSMQALAAKVRETLDKE